MKSFHLTNQQGLSLYGLNYGATLTSLSVPIDGQCRELLLGCANQDYPRQQVWLGAVAGRFANRIGYARLTHQDKTWQLTANQPPHCLHGGHQGFHRKFWHICQQMSDQIELSLHSPDGDQGFPGNLSVTLQYRLERLDLVITFTAVTDAPTPVNLTSHLYFNLDGDGDIRQHHLTLKADRFLATDSCGLPICLMPVNSVFDLRYGQQLNEGWFSHPQQKQAKGYDHAFLRSCSAESWLARLVSGDKKLALEMYTNQPSVQLYTGNWLANTPNRQGSVYQDYQGICLEAQQLPDSPNRPELGDPWLLPGQVYRHITRYRLIPQ